MPQEFQTFCIGAAVVLDTALLLSVLERRNWQQVTMPILALIAGAWLFHSGEFGNLLLLEAGRWSEPARWFAMSTMATGLMLMPSSMLHGLLRVWRTGFDLKVRSRWAYGLAYVPMLIVPFAMRSIATHAGTPFLERLAAYVSPYIMLTTAVNVAAVATFWRQRRLTDNRALRRFLGWMCGILVVLTLLLCCAFWVLDETWTETGSPLLLLVVMSPMAPALLFAYFVIRYRFMRLVVERTFVYGAILAGALLFHELVVQDVTQELGERFRIDFGILEGVIVFLLVVLYQPVRQRVAEALRYLMGRSPINIRQRTRELAVEMWQHVNDDPQQLVDWFVNAIRESLEVDWAAAALFDAHAKPYIVSRAGTDLEEAQMVQLHNAIRSHQYVSCHDPRADQHAVAVLEVLDGALAIRVDHEGISGLLALGRRRGASELGEEETSAVLLLVELVAATLNNHYLQQRRLLAERRAAQNEKLSTLGLLTSCITHEIKNPLSSIKTIATVLAEQLGDDNEYAEDLELILDEADRLSDTTTQFLKFARPASSLAGETSLQTIIDGSIHVLGHLARKQNVAIRSAIDSELPKLAASENLLREIAFNLLLNSIEAAGQGGAVEVSARLHGESIIASFRDNGPGIASEVKERIFEPFVTSKPSGTGLGLYIVKRNVEELGGEIECGSEDGAGTCFTLRLPLTAAAESSGLSERAKGG